ncbi:3-phosphoshikimate 1-carboxyvinyltransferase [Ferruginibacter yonginensis]|uniref:3-phosphoshikimate 1-carboxyvinyltransferase n=1 Tax=Ferruginibacter yonginensis TaxID=1310416 RepID=A0ABV8QNL7_9BACT
MQVTVSPSTVSGILNAPVSKSAMQRACAAALLHNGATNLYNFGNSNDDKAALNIIQQLGVTVKEMHDHLSITSNGFPPTQKINATTIHCGESGLSFRMFAPIVATSVMPITLTGEGSLVKRSMSFFDEVMPLLHVGIQSNNGFLPLQLKGPLVADDIIIDGSMSSQYLTGLLFAFAHTVTSTKTITVNNLKSKPYIDLTLQVMQHFGYQIKHSNYQQFIIEPHKNKASSTINYLVEGDWSNAAFLLVAGAIAGDVTIKGLQPTSTQADKAIVTVLRSANATINVDNDVIAVHKSDLHAFEFDATDAPDLFPPLAVLAVNCKGTSVIKGVHRLTSKESDRAVAIKDIFTKMGASIWVDNDAMYIEGATLQGATVHSHHDHRIAMAATVAALKASSTVIINDAAAVNKSYPTFYSDIAKLGVPIIETYI